MAEQTYIVALEKGESKDQILTELTSESGNDYVPDRTVDIVLPRAGSKRHFEIALSEDEAVTLRTDPRVKNVQQPVNWHDDFLDFEKNPRTNWKREHSDTTGNNWGLLRHIETTNNWSNVQSDFRSSANYTGHLDGTGVDIVVHEGGQARPDHVEFLDSSGATRYQQYQWNSQAAVSGASTISYGSGLDSHATHVLGTMGGLNVGWAFNAKLYSCPVDYLGGQSYWFDVVKEFHKAKSVETNGFKRPTVMNMSWGAKTYMTSITAIYFRGSNVGTSPSNAYGLVGDSISRVNCPIYDFESEVEELEDEGVICIKSAGNQYQKLDVSGGLDYDNYFTRSVASGNVSAGQPLYYNRGSSNRSSNTILVGALSSDLYTGSQEATTEFSEKGPRVDVWAAGEDIVSGIATGTSDYTVYDGTSMAAPQVSGMVALLMQMNPGMTQVEARNWILNNAKTGLYLGDTNTSTYFTDNRNRMGASDRIAYWPYSQHLPVHFSHLSSSNISI